MELNSGIFCSEVPVDARGRLVSALLPSIDLAFKIFLTLHALL